MRVLCVNAQGVEVCLWQVWKDCDKRMNRHVKVIGYDAADRKVAAAHCTPDGRITNVQRNSRIALRRFHKHSTGFELVREAA